MVLPQNTFFAMPEPDTQTKNIFKYYQDRGAKRFAVIGRQEAGISDGNLNRVFCMLLQPHEQHPNYCAAAGPPLFGTNAPSSLAGNSATMGSGENVTVVMKRCTSVSAEPDADDCQTDADCSGSTFFRGTRVPDTCGPAQVELVQFKFKSNPTLNLLNPTLTRNPTPGPTLLHGVR